MRNFSDIAKPLHRLTEEKQNFVWTHDSQQALEHLKKQLAETPILAYPSPDTEFILDTDAPNFTLRAVLSQGQGGTERIIANFFKTFERSKRNYCGTKMSSFLQES